MAILKNFSVLSYSKQQLVDCAKKGEYSDPDGCKGAYTRLAFEYLTTHELKMESEYPYTAKVHTATSYFLYTVKHSSMANVKLPTLGTIFC